MTKVRNAITKLTDENGEVLGNPRKIESIAVEYFSGLFTGSHNTNMVKVLQCVQPRVTPEMNDNICAPLTREEIQKALAQMHPHKAWVQMGIMHGSTKNTGT